MMEGPIEHNLRALIEFRSSGDTQLKGDQAGNLYHTTSFRNGFGYWGTSFSVTAQLVKKTARSACAQLDKKMRKLWQMLELPNLPSSCLRHKMLRFKEDYREKEELIQAIKWVVRTYLERYGKRHRGVVAAAKALEESKTSQQRAAKSYSLFIDKFPEWNRGKGYYLDPYLKTLKAESSPLFTYCETFCPSFTYRQAMDSVEKGRLLYGKIRSTRLDWVSEDGDVACAEIASLVWYLTACALQKGCMFRQGTLVVEDPGNRLFHFFDSYTEERGGQYKIACQTALPGENGTLFFGRVKHPKEALFKLTLRPKKEPSSFGWLFARSPCEEGGHERKIPKEILEPFKELAELMPAKLCEKMHFMAEKRGISYIFSLARELHLLLAGGEKEGENPLLSKPILYELYDRCCHPENSEPRLLALPELSSLDRSRLKELLQNLRKGLSFYSDLHLGYRYGNEVLLTQKDLI